LATLHGTLWFQKAWHISSSDLNISNIIPLVLNVLLVLNILVTVWNGTGKLLQSLYWSVFQFQRSCR